MRRHAGVPGSRCREIHGASRGFTLVEILVAFTMLALFVAATFDVLSTGVRSTTLAEEYARAQSLARSKLDELAASPALVAGEERGRVAATVAPALRWRTTVEEYELQVDGAAVSAELVTPLLAVVEVSWGGGEALGEPRRIELRALLLGPAAP